MKTTVIYHRADFDGLFCREIARKFLPGAELVGWDYGDPLIPFPSEGQVYILDLSPDSIVSGLADFSRLVWIDHHATAIAKYSTTIPGYRIDGVAACRLVWQWFWAHKGLSDDSIPPLPSKQDFVDRKVSEPFAVQLAGEYDIWDKRDPRAELFQHGLKSQSLDNVWAPLLACEDPFNISLVSRLLQQGSAIQYAKVQENEGIINAFGFTVQFEGFCLLACNAARYNSQLFTAGLKPEHDGCLGFNWDGQAKVWRISLYTDKPGVDLSPVAVKYGGGGHRGACGFRIEKLPFLT